MQHDMRFEAGDAGESLIADRAGEVGCCVRGLVECEVKLHVKRLRAVVTSVRLPRTDDTLTFSQAVYSDTVWCMALDGRCGVWRTSVLQPQPTAAVTLSLLSCSRRCFCSWLSVVKT